MKLLLFTVLLLPLVAAAQPGERSGERPAEPLTWRDAADPEAVAASAEGLPSLVYVHAAWCGPCRRMERDVFPAVRPLLDRLNRLALDFGDRDAPPGAPPGAPSPFALALALGAESTPSFVLLAPDGAPIARAAGFLDARAFGLLLAYATSGAYRHASFETYVARTASPPPAP